MELLVLEDVSLKAYALKGQSLNNMHMLKITLRHALLAILILPVQTSH